MAKIYVDTNLFLDSYRSGSDDVLDELSRHKGSLVLTEQTIGEFRRNRLTRLRALITEFSQTLRAHNPGGIAVLRALPGHDDLAAEWQAYKRRAGAVLRKLEQMSADEHKDPIAQKFQALAADAAVVKLPLTDQSIERAHRRKLLGNPPRSLDKYSVGDEVIWELLLANMQEGLAIVTKDGAFHDWMPLLAEEYRERTGKKLLLVTKKLSEALTKIGERPTAKLVKAEEKEQQSLPPPPQPIRFYVAGPAAADIAAWQGSQTAAVYASATNMGSPPVLLASSTQAGGT